MKRRIGWIVRRTARHGAWRPKSRIWADNTIAPSRSPIGSRAADATRPLVYPAGYRTVICEAAERFKVDPLWLHAIIWQESKYNPNSRSGAAARGLMQFIPDTANAVGVKIGLGTVSLEKLFDPAVSIQLGAAYWAFLMDKFKSPELALAAYNGGPDNVERWLNKSSDPELFVSDIGFVETKKYVMSVVTAHAAYVSLQ